MKKHFKRIMALVIAMVMVVGMSVTAFAADPDPVDPSATAPTDNTDPGNYVIGGSTTFTITIPETTKDATNEVSHTYAAYQIFKGDLNVATDGTKTLSNIDWGSGVNTTGLVAALAADTTLSALGITNTMTAAQVADKLNAQAFDSNAARAFAAVVAGYLKTTATGTSTYDDDEDVYTISDLAAGYYLVQDIDSATGDDAESAQEMYAMTRYMLEVVGDVTAQPKQDVPSLDKDIITTTNNSKTGTETKVEAADYNIGDVITYELYATLPTNYAIYDEYNYIFHDTLSVGQSFDPANVHVYVDTVATANEIAKTNYSVSPTTAATGATATTITITFDDLKDVTSPAITKDSKIIVRYTATLTKDAVIGNDGNPNEAYLEYSNNPNGDGTGKTVTDEVVVFTYELDNTKVDGETYKKAYYAALTGADVSSITSVPTDSQISTAESGKTAAELAAATASAKAAATKLQDAQFVLKAKEGEHSGKYVQIDAATGKVTGWLDAQPAVASTIPTSGNTGILASKASTGRFDIIGLDAGEYELIEIKAPAGYNLLANSIKVVIAATITGSDTATHDTVTPALTALTINVDDNGATAGDPDEGTVDTTIENNKGTVLPSTGGMGTTIFYIVGAILVVGAGVILITRRRMRAE